MHPNYGNLDWDYALIEVQQLFELGQPGVESITLTEEEPVADTSVVVSGWGTLSSGGPISKNLQAVSDNIVSRDCSKAYGGITERMICAGVPEGDKDIYQEDTGGSLVNKESGELVGVFSWGRGCADKGYPGVYAKVATVRDWINEYIGV